MFVIIDVVDMIKNNRVTRNLGSEYPGLTKKKQLTITRVLQ